MNNLVPTGEYSIWYDPLHQGTRIKTIKAEYFIPDNRMIDDPISMSMIELEQFKIK